MKQTTSKIDTLARSIGLYIAFFCIGLGLISVISSNWQDISEFAKLTAAAIILAVTAAGIFISRQKEKRTLSEALIIFDVGSTIEYIKSNETVKQLPDKAVIALDKWLESVSESDTTKTK